jgi:DNA-binding NtrC family response regulator
VFARALERRLTSSNWEVTVVADGSEAITALGQTSFDAMVLDLQMQQIGGMEVLAQLGDFPAPPVTVLLSGHLDIPKTVNAMRAGAIDVMEKPVDGNALEERLRTAVELKRSQPAGEGGSLPGANGTEPLKLRDLERDLIVRMYESSEKNLSLTARRLGLPRTTVRDKLKRYGVR